MAYTVPAWIAMIILNFFYPGPAFVHGRAIRWSQTILRLSGIDVVVRGREYLDHRKGYLFLSNHQSAFDIYALFSALDRRFCFISKQLYFRVPFIGSAMKKAEYIPIARHHPRRAMGALRQAAARLRDNVSVVIFPEGTRSADGQVGPFKSGLLKIIHFLEGGDVVPVTIYGSRFILPKGKLTLTKGVITVTFGRPVSVSPGISKDREKKARLFEKIEKTVRDTYTAMERSNQMDRIKKAESS